MTIINSPLSVPVSKNKNFILNLNNYRNTHYQALNKAKLNDTAIMAEQIGQMEKAGQAEIHYRLFPKTKRLTDIGNVISIHKKFFEDALVEMGVLEDDNYKFVIGSSETFGGVDPDNPRVEIKVIDIDKS